MRQILILTVVLLLVPLAFFSPLLGLIGYIWIAYVRPHEWAYMPGAQLSLAVALATLGGYICFEFMRRSPQLIPNGLILLLWAQLTAATYLASSPDLAQGKLIEFSKTFLMALLLTAMVDSEKRVRWLLWGAIVSIGFLAFRSNIGIILALGQTRIYGPGGAFEDNNDYALLLVVAAPITYYAARAEKVYRLKLLGYALSVMMMVTIVFTLSRGGFLGALAVAVMAAMRSRARWRSLLLVMVLMLGALWLAPSRVVERVESIRTAYTMDESARMRLETWAVCARIIADHPLFGVGPRNILEVYERYLTTETVRVAHNAFLQMAVDAGLPGLGFFLGLFALSFYRLRRVRKWWRERSPDSPLIEYSQGLEIALVGYLVAANFLSRHDLELVYQVMALATSFHVMTREAERAARLNEMVKSIA